MLSDFVEDRTLETYSRALVKAEKARLAGRGVAFGTAYCAVGLHSTRNTQG